MSFDKTFDGSDAHLMPADAAACVAFLRGYQAWRRFDGEIDEEGPAMPHPKSIGFAIDMAIQLIEQHGELLAACKSAIEISDARLQGDGGFRSPECQAIYDQFAAAIASAKGSA